MKQHTGEKTYDTTKDKN